MTEEIEQRSEAWFAERLGKVTASKIGDLMARTKTGYGASRENYMATLLVERLTGQPTEHYTNAAMQWGVDHEEEARAAYSFDTGEEVKEVGFVPHPFIEMAGASPDGLVNEIGLVEFKCPNTATHVDFLLCGAIEKKYVLQMQFQMACTNREWCDFCSYDCRLPFELQKKTIRVNRDDKLIAEIEDEVRKFLNELSEKEAKLRLLGQLN